MSVLDSFKELVKISFACLNSFDAFVLKLDSAFGEFEKGL